MASSGARSGALPALLKEAPTGWSCITDFFDPLKKVGRPLGATATKVGRPPLPVALPPAPKKPEEPAAKMLKTSRAHYGKGEYNASMMAAVSEWDDNITKPVAEQMSMVRFLTDSL